MKTLPVETELRLAAAPKAFARLIGSRALRRLQVSPPTTFDLTSIYWDTKRLSFGAAGVGVRTRWDGRKWVQTVKLPTRSNVTRREFETAADGESPRLADAIRAGATLKHSLAAKADALRPVFRSEITRIAQTLTFSDGTVAELARDRGRLLVPRAPGAETSICEIEIELKRGDIRRIYELAFQLVTEVPGLRVLVATKAERGYALVTHASAPPRKAYPLDLRRRSSAKALTVAAAMEALAQVESNVEGSRTTLDPEFVHQLRVGLRRLRVTTTMAEASGLPTFSPRLQTELKWFWRVVSATRDWDVMETETWPAVRNEAVQSTQAASIDELISRARRDSRRKLGRALDARRFQRMLLALGWVLENQRAASVAAGAHDAAWLGRKILGKSLKRLSQRAGDIDALTSAQRHRVRIEAKKLRYMAEYFTDAYPGRRVKRYLRRLAAVQAALGALNDLDVAGALLEPLFGDAQKESSVAELWRAHVFATEHALHVALVDAWNDFAATEPFWN